MFKRTKCLRIARVARGTNIHGAESPAAKLNNTVLMQTSCETGAIYSADTNQIHHGKRKNNRRGWESEGNEEKEHHNETQS